MLMFFVAAVPAAAQQTPRERLQNIFESVQFHEVGERVRTVYGARMTVGKTPSEAATAWLALYGDVFADGPLDVEEFRAMPRPKHEGTVLMYRQRMDDLPVLGSSLRVMTFGEDPSRVVYAAARVAIRPKGGLPEPKVTPRQAVEAAEKHPEAEGLTNWSEPDLVAIYDDSPAGDAVAYPVWRCAGTRAQPYESKTFYINAVTGEVSRHHSNIMRSMDITGTATGKATPADSNANPEELGPDTSTPTTQCPNDPDTFNIRDLLIRAFQGTTLIATASTGANGAYTLEMAGTQTVDVHASLIGPSWEVLDGRTETWGEPIDPIIVTNVTNPATGVNFAFNSSPTEFGTAAMNAHLSMARTWEYLGLEIDVMPSALVVVHSDTDSCNAYFVPPGDDPDDPPYPGVLKFFQSTSSCPNSAYATVIAHEYGHLLAWYLLGIENLGTNAFTWAFHEGFADTLGHLVFDSDVMGQDWSGCGNHLREPLDFDPSYPVCPPGSQYNRYEAGMLLSALWLDIRSELGANDTQTLFQAWIGLAQLPTTLVSCSGWSIQLPQAADEGTLIEILTADAPDSNPVNAVHLEEICDIFFERNIDTGVCPDSAGGLRRADCDRSGTLDLFDFLCFQNQFAAGARYADCDRDGRLTVLDFVCFQERFVAANR